MDAHSMHIFQKSSIVKKKKYYLISFEIIDFKIVRMIYKYSSYKKNFF